MKIAAVFAALVLVVGVAYLGVANRKLPYAQGTVVAASDLASAVRMSEVIVVGRVVADAGLRNTARDPRDLSRPDPELTMNTRFYTVAVESVLKGVATLTITVGSAYSSSGRRGVWTDEYLSENFAPLAIGARYALMLRADRFEPGHYALAFEPSRFELSETAIVRSNLAQAETNFPAIPTDAFIAAVRAAAAAEPR